MTAIIKQTDTFRQWEAALRDTRVRTIIAARINRVAEGLTGGVEPVGEGISELKIDFGPGYRVYFKKKADILIVLLCGGDKSSQKEDIKIAKKLATDGGF